MFSLQWTHRALVMLGAIWVNADEWERQEIRSALQELIVELTDQPQAVGESRAGMRSAASGASICDDHRFFPAYAPGRSPTGPGDSPQLAGRQEYLTHRAH